MSYDISIYKKKFSDKLSKIIDHKYQKENETKRKAQFKKDFSEMFLLDYKKFSNTTSEWFYKGGTPNFDNLIRLCNFFHCDIEYFLTEQDSFVLNTQTAAEHLELKYETIEKIKNYDNSIKEMIDRLCNHNTDDIKFLLNTLLRYALSSSSKVIIENNLFDQKEELDYIDSKNILAYDAAENFKFILNDVRDLYHDDIMNMYENEIKILKLKTEIEKIKNTVDEINTKGSD